MLVVLVASLAFAAFFAFVTVEKEEKSKWTAEKRCCGGQEIEISERDCRNKRLWRS